MSDISLPYLRTSIREALSRYESYHSHLFEFGDFADFQRTPEKPNTARTVIPVLVEGTPVGNMVAVVFAPGDGTGDTKTYSLDQVSIPEVFRYQSKPERILPRAKGSIVAEGFFPLGSYLGDRLVSPFAACLDELTVDEQMAVRPVWTLGLTQEEYLDTLRHGRSTPPRVEFTVGKTPTGERFGDPHSIIYRTPSTAIQVAGFLTITDENSPLLKIAEQWWARPERA